MDKAKMSKEAEKLTELKDEKAKIEAELRNIKAKIDAQEKIVIELITEAELPAFKGYNNVTYSIKTEVFPNVLVKDRPALIEALRKNGYEVLIKEEVNAKTLKAFIEEQGWETTEQLPTYLQGIVSLYQKTKIGTRRS